MAKDNEIQNSEMYLPGGFGTVKVGEQVHEIKEVFKGNNGLLTITLQNTNKNSETKVIGRPNKFAFFIPKKLPNG